MSTLKIGQVVDSTGHIWVCLVILRGPLIFPPVLLALVLREFSRLALVPPNTGAPSSASSAAPAQKLLRREAFSALAGRPASYEPCLEIRAVTAPFSFTSRLPGPAWTPCGRPPPAQVSTSTSMHYLAFVVKRKMRPPGGMDHSGRQGAGTGCRRPPQHRAQQGPGPQPHQPQQVHLKAGVSLQGQGFPIHAWESRARNTEKIRLRVCAHDPRKLDKNQTTTTIT